MGRGMSNVGLGVGESERQIEQTKAPWWPPPVAYTRITIVTLIAARHEALLI